MFYFDIQRFGGGTTQTTVPEHFSDRTKIPGLDTATNQQIDFNALANQLSIVLLQQALASSGYRVNQTPTGRPTELAGPDYAHLVGNNSINKQQGWQFGNDKNAEATVNAMRDAFREGKVWGGAGGDNGTWVEAQGGIPELTDYFKKSYADSAAYNKSARHVADNFDAYINEAKYRAFGTPYANANTDTNSAPISSYTMDTSSRITPDYAGMYNKGIADMSALQSGYGASSQGYIDSLNALNPEYERLRNENAAETRALQGRYDALGASNTAENNALRGRYDANMADYNAKMNSLQQGILPTNFTNNQQKILNDSAQQAVGSLLSELGGSGSINSSLSRQGIGDINYNTQRTMADYFDRSINSLASMAGQQYWGNNRGLDANGDLIQRNFSNGMGVLDANGNLIQQRFGNGMTGLNAQANNIGNAFNLNQTRFGTQMQGITAPMQFAAASQEAQDAPLTRLISNANATNQYPFNFWNANNASWANMNTPEQTIVTQKEGIGGALGGLAGLATKVIK